MKKIGFFEESEGVRSMTRLMSFLLLIFFFLLNAIYFMGNGQVDYNFISFDFMLLLAIFTPKLIQKYAEVAQLPAR